MMRFRVDGKQRFQRSYLSEILDIANDTARRISAICQLRYEDIQLTPTPIAPHGTIRWPRSTDEDGRAWAAPITPPVRAVLERVLRERPNIGAAYLFPSPAGPTRRIDDGLASGGLLRAEWLAGLPKLKRRRWHPYRRRCAGRLSANTSRSPTSPRPAGGSPCRPSSSASSSRMKRRCLSRSGWGRAPGKSQSMNPGRSYTGSFRTRHSGVALGTANCFDLSSLRACSSGG
jgi:hypothetical protein